LDFEDGNIKGTTTEIVDCDNGITGFVETVSEGSGSGFVNDTKDI
jgi:hypothetical protein